MSHSRRVSVAAVALLALLACSTPQESPPAAEQSPLDWVAEADIARLQQALESGELTSEALVEALLDRIARLDDAGPTLNAILDVAPDALEQARLLDQERQDGSLRGPLHGLPVLLKGNVDVAGLPNTAGSAALEGHVPDDDAFLVARLREAGAVVLGTANLSEWANFRSSRSSSGWSSLGRQTRNPHVLDRNPCGSSSGSAVAVAAGLTVVSIGTETDGSVVCPAGQNGVVGIKPTVGLVSRDGIIPIAHSQDTAGPMGRTVRDAALVLQAIAVVDAGDQATASQPTPAPDYLSSLTDDVRLDGVRIGVWRNHFGAGDDPDVEACLDGALEAFRSLGAEIVDPVELDMDGVGSAEGTVLHTEFRHDLPAYLESHGFPNGLRSVEDVMAFNEAHAEQVMPYFGQERMAETVEQGGLDDPEYRKALDDSKRLSRGAIDGALSEHQVTALVAPTNSPAWPIDLANGDHFVLSSSQPAAVSGYPNVTLPMCAVHRLPVGLSIFGAAYGEVELLRIAHALEGALQPRPTPEFLPTLDLP